MLYGCLHPTVGIRGNNEALLLRARCELNGRPNNDRKSVPRIAPKARTPTGSSRQGFLSVYSGVQIQRDLADKIMLGS